MNRYYLFSVVTNNQNILIIDCLLLFNIVKFISMKKHEVIIKGGLGNQLFCLFFAYKLSLATNVKVSLNLSNYFFLERKDRLFFLESLYPSLFDDFIKSDSILSKFLFQYSKIYEKIFISKKSDRLPGDNPFFINYWPRRFIHSGYYQKINYSELDQRSLDFMKNRINPIFKKNKSNLLALHLRRGDYLSKKHSIHGIILEKYLFNEARKILNKNDFDGITIFSDSPNLVDYNKFESLHQKILIDKGGDPREVFKRMLNHKGLIASNSSFSLWAGLLGDIKIFSIPYYWMKNKKSDLIGLEKINRFNCKI